jgi:hypothetical protein
MTRIAFHTIAQDMLLAVVRPRAGDSRPSGGDD